MAVIVDQKRLGGGSHSTVGTITDIYTRAAPAVLARGQAARRATRTRSRSTTRRACARSATASGKKLGVVSDDFLDMSQVAQRRRGAGAVLRRLGRACATRLRGFFDNDKKLANFTKEEMDLLLHGKDRKFKMKFGERRDQRHLRGHHREVSSARTSAATSRRSRERTQKAVDAVPEPCGPARRARARASARRRSRQDQRPQHRRAVGDGDRRPDAGRAARSTSPMAGADRERRSSSGCRHVVDIGLEYLSLNRETDTLSGGESQRVKMVKHLGSSLVDVMYIFDEPSVGLHPRDVHRLNELLGKLRDKGNTVLVVEHDPDVIEVADHIVDVGPQRGQRRRDDRLRGQLRRAAARRHADRPPSAAGAADQRRTCASPPASCPSRTPARTTCRTSASTSRRAC